MILLDDRLTELSMSNHPKSTVEAGSISHEQQPPVDQNSHIVVGTIAIETATDAEIQRDWDMAIASDIFRTGAANERSILGLEDELLLSEFAVEYAEADLAAAKEEMRETRSLGRQILDGIVGAKSTKLTPPAMLRVTKVVEQAKEQLDIDRQKAQEVQFMAYTSKEYLLDVAHPDFSKETVIFGLNLVIGNLSRSQVEEPVAAAPSIERKIVATAYSEAFDGYADKLEYWAGVLHDNPISDELKEKHPILANMTPAVMVGLEFEAAYEKRRADKLSDKTEDHFIYQQAKIESFAKKSVLTAQHNVDIYMSSKKAKKSIRKSEEAMERFVEASKARDEAMLEQIIDGPIEFHVQRHQKLTNAINAIRDGKKIKRAWIPVLSDYLGE